MSMHDQAMAWAELGDAYGDWPLANDRDFIAILTDIERRWEAGEFTPQSKFNESMAVAGRLYRNRVEAGE